MRPSLKFFSNFRLLPSSELDIVFFRASFKGFFITFCTIEIDYLRSFRNVQRLTLRFVVLPSWSQWLNAL